MLGRVLLLQILQKYLQDDPAFKKTKTINETTNIYKDDSTLLVVPSGFLTDSFVTCSLRGSQRQVRWLPPNAATSVNDGLRRGVGTDLLNTSI